MNKQSVWLRTLTNAPHYPQLTTALEVDIVIIGAGITGLTTAMQLSQSGKSVAVIEANTIGSGTTGGSTANLYVPIQAQYGQISKKFNPQAAKLVAQSRQAAIDYIERTINAYQISCNFLRRPWYMFTKLSNKNRMIELELEALNQCGVPATATQDLPFPAHYTKAITLAGQARFNPLLYLYGLARIITEHGCQLYEHSPVINYKEHKTHCEIQTDKARIKANTLIMATHLPIGFNMLQFKAFPYRSYASAAKLADGIYPNGIFWEMGDFHFSTSTHNRAGTDLDLIIVSGNHHKTGQASQSCHEHHAKLVESYLKENFKVNTLEYQWSAQHYQPADGLPYIGLASRVSKHTYTATGYSADGLTYGTLAGILLADLLQAKENPWAAVYKATRFNPKASAARMIKENANVLGEYLTDYPGNVETKYYTSIKPGEGKIMADGGEKWAVHRDFDNKLHRVSAVCTHMKCIVKWNDAERSWDCPCHGSRFTPQGEIIEGPALTPLKPKPF